MKVNSENPITGAQQDVCNVSLMKSMLCETFWIVTANSLFSRLSSCLWPDPKMEAK